MSLMSPVSCASYDFSFLSHRLLFGLLYFLSSDESDSLGDDSDKLGSDSGSSCTYSFCAFSLCFDHSVGSVSLFGCGIFAPTGVESKGDIFGETIAVGVSQARSDYNYNYKTEFQTWKENKKLSAIFF